MVADGPRAWSIASHGFEAHEGFSLPPRTLVAGVMGSGAHGTSSSKPRSIDDIDLMVLCQPPLDRYIGLTRWTHCCPPVGTLSDGVDLVSYSLHKATLLLLKGNPNIVGLLWLPAHNLVSRHSLWELWLERRHIFLSQRVLDSFAGYAVGQLQRLGKPNTRGYMGRERKALFERFGYDPKNAAHCLRLLRMGLELAHTGELRVDRSGIDAEELRAVKRGDWPLRRIEAEAEAGVKALAEARSLSALPPEPDRAAAEELLLKTTQALW